ncbi:phasin family protein [Spartinivicinus poritis]|uniref:Phasin family protein n=1 Tax=Spartinivicinus poritis TaxID=2994640 RepID=A0ABT5UE39_9GAMM|nr:phasin family protein [Spartinivicinus sp. A2-2]MDE1464582.1 phasin family protein [Spartinivicinus sp. A2-2]
MELVKDNGLPLGPLKNAAHKIWLAGLGAFVQLEKAGQESHRLFDHLVEEGEKLEQRLHEQHDKTNQEKSAQSVPDSLSSKHKHSEDAANQEPDLRTLLNQLSTELSHLTTIVKSLQNDRQTAEQNKPRSASSHSSNHKRKNRH